ncbi:MAG: hypothetical protein IJU37_11940 [Desulfovibrio sp.]|nr:hypothetical protein [Desulfovibrio sp.]
MKLLRHFPSVMVHRVLYQQDCDIDKSFVGFIETYKRLAKLIPKTWIVVDLGCAYAPQCAYFRKHKAYIGVDWGDHFRFFTPNTHHVQQSIEDWIAQNAQSMPRTTFAIANYSLKDSSIVRHAFEHCYTFFPERDATWP